MFTAHEKSIQGPMAQLGARLNGIEEVEGSNPSGSTVRNGRLAPSVLQVYNASKVRTGVVGHPVSEKGERGGSPSTASNGNAIRQDRTRLFLARGLRW